MAWVVDASVAVKWLVVEEDADRAVALLSSNERLLAPRWIMIELANVLWKKCRQNVLTPTVARERLDLAARYFAEVLDTPDLSAVLEMAIKLGHPVYDCIYIETALRQGVGLVTADRRLSVKARSIPELHVCDLSDWRAA